MKSSFCIDLQRFMLIPTKFPLSPKTTFNLLSSFIVNVFKFVAKLSTITENTKLIHIICVVSKKIRI